MAHGTHSVRDDHRNNDILIWVNGELKTRHQATVSVFDSGFVLGDGVWEGLRVYRGHPAFLDQHLDRLWEGAQAIMLELTVSREELTNAIYQTLQANKMVGDGVHLRLMVSRGVKQTPYQDPRVTVGPPTIVIIAEYKEPLPQTVAEGITLFTTHIRRATPDTLDPKLNAHSKLNDIQACIQAYTAGADEALMLDPHGFVATCNSTHFFIVKGSPQYPEIWTSDGRFCLNGITRRNVLTMCREKKLPTRETTFSLTDVYSAREAFVTGTFAGIVPVRSVDGRTIGSGLRGPVVNQLQSWYDEYVAAEISQRITGTP
jgi:branched-chain amino acid aminotransferase